MVAYYEHLGTSPNDTTTGYTDSYPLDVVKSWIHASVPIDQGRVLQWYNSSALLEDQPFDCDFVVAAFLSSL